MSSSRWGRQWADLEEDDVVDIPSSKTRFETEADAKGLKTVIEYAERDGKTYKVTKKVKQTTMTRRVNLAIEHRKGWASFGKCGDAEDEEGNTISVKPIKSNEEYFIELTQKVGGAQATTTLNEAEEKFLEASLNISEELFKDKKVWTDINRMKQEEREREAEKETVKPAADGGPAAAAGGKGAAAGGRYVPPSLREGGGDGKGGKGDRDQEASLRVFNLSEDAKDGDLQELFGQFGRLQRVFLAKHMDTGQSKGFAFVTYYNKEDGEKAIRKLNGHGYDNLILKVEWAKPRA